MNNVCMTGHLARDPELRTTTNGKAVAGFTLAVNRRFKQEGQPSADFIPCVAWNKLAELVGNYLHKGSKILVEGRIQVRNYDAQDGSKRYVTEVIADEIEFLDKKQDSGSGAGQFGATVPDNEVPF